MLTSMAMFYVGLSFMIFALQGVNRGDSCSNDSTLYDDDTEDATVVDYPFVEERSGREGEGKCRELLPPENQASDGLRRSARLKSFLKTTTCKKCNSPFACLKDGLCSGCRQCNSLAGDSYASSCCGSSRCPSCSRSIAFSDESHDSTISAIR